MLFQLKFFLDTLQAYRGHLKMDESGIPTDLERVQYFLDTTLIKSLKKMNQRFVEETMLYTPAVDAITYLPKSEVIPQ